MNPAVFIGESIYYPEKQLYINIPKVKDVVANPNYSAYASMFTMSQEDIWDMIAEKNGQMPDGTPILSAPTPFELFLINCNNSNEFMQKAIDAFIFWTGKLVKIIPASKIILFVDSLKVAKEARFLTTIEEKDFLGFQNIIRTAIGEKPVDPPNPNENPKVALIKAKGRYRERIKRKNGNKNAIPFSKTLVALCCMNIGLTPLNIGEIPYPAVSELFTMAQDKEKYETDLKIATAGFGNKKVKPKYWIQNKD